MAAVVVNHAWPGVLPGGYVGVDVFFVISGFLITSHLVERPPTRLYDLAVFWGRRVRRLLPAALLVLLAVVVLTVAFAPRVAWANNVRAVVAASTYWINWQLADDAVDYLRGDDMATPVQHYWSLSVEEQFYLVWPVLLLVLGLLFRKRFRRVVPVMLGVILAGSLVASVWLTHTNPSAAYFVTQTRAWEFAAGGLLAVLGVALPRWCSLLGWAGIVATTVLYTADTPFPGWTALLPVLAAAVVIAARDQNPVVALPPVQWVGDVSYSLYLWHWPLLLFTPLALPGAATWSQPVIAVAAALVLAGLTKTLAEDPILGRGRLALPTFRLRWLYPAAALGMAVVIAASAAVTWQLHRGVGQATALPTTVLPAVDPAASVETDPDPTFGIPDCFGARAAEPGADCPASEWGQLVNLQQLTIGQDLWKGTDEFFANCVGTYDTQAEGHPTCEVGADVTASTLHVALVGSSMAAHWVSALEQIAAYQKWQVTTHIMERCPFTLDALPNENLKGCAAWSQLALDDLVQEHPDLVIVGGTGDIGPSAGLTGIMQTLTDAGIKSVWLPLSPGAPGTPGIPVEIPYCLYLHQDDMQTCGLGTGEVLLHPMIDATTQFDSPDMVTTLDLNPLLCPEGDPCGGVLGNVIKLSDGGHMTQTYARSLAPSLYQALKATGFLSGNQAG